MRAIVCVGAIMLAIVLEACKSQTGIATTDAAGKAQLDVINATTNEADGKGDDRKALGVHTMGERMRSTDMPPKTQ